jgi:hypothetical protein
MAIYGQIRSHIDGQSGRPSDNPETSRGSRVIEPRIPRQQAEPPEWGIITSESHFSNPPAYEGAIDSHAVPDFTGMTAEASKTASAPPRQSYASRPSDRFNELPAQLVSAAENADPLPFDGLNVGDLWSWMLFMT